MKEVTSVYKAFFGFKADPFSLSPDPAFLYRSEQHEEVISNLIYGVQGRKGFIVLTGEVGTGKTTMLNVCGIICTSSPSNSVSFSIRGSPAISFSR